MVSYEPLVRYDAEQKKFVAVPIELRADEQAFLVLYGTGLRRAGEVKANLDGNTVEPLYVGEQGYFIGVDQVNLRLLPGLSGRGTITVTLEADGQLTNPVSLTIK